MLWVFFALLSAAAWAVEEIIRKRVLKVDTPVEFSTERGFFVIIILLCVIPFLKWSSISTEFILASLSISIILTLVVYLSSKTLKLGDVSEIAPMMNLSPLFLLPLAAIFLGEHLTSMQWLGVIALIIGTYVLELHHNQHDVLAPFRKLFKSKYFIYLFLLLIIMSIAALVDKTNINKGYDILTYMFFVWMFISIQFFIIDWFATRLKNFTKHIRKKGGLIFVNAMASVFSTFFVLSAMAVGPVSLVIPIRRLGTLGSAVIGGKIEHERDLMRKAIACLIMIIGAVFISVF